MEENSLTISSKQSGCMRSNVSKYIIQLVTLIVALMLIVGSFIYIFKLVNIYKWVQDAEEFE